MLTFAPFRPSLNLNLPFRPSPKRSPRVFPEKRAPLENLGSPSREREREREALDGVDGLLGVERASG